MRTGLFQKSTSIVEFGNVFGYESRARIKGQNCYSELAHMSLLRVVCGSARRNEHVRHATHMMLSERPPKLNGKRRRFLGIHRFITAGVAPPRPDTIAIVFHGGVRISKYYYPPLKSSAGSSWAAGAHLLEAHARCRKKRVLLN
jgi:hypothetical protein